MTGPVPGHSGQPRDPQCYNCGALGHWAMACPEPTRETPAGLAAWRSSSSTGQGHVKSHNVGSKKAKGPIITKYAPPPPPQPPSFNPGMGHYPPPPPVPPPVNHPPHHQPPVLYPVPNPPYQSYGPPPPYPPGYHQPAYGYASSQYAPPASPVPVPYGPPPPYSQTGYMPPLPGLPPPPPASYSQLRSTAPEYRPAPPPPQYHQPFPPSSSYGPGPLPNPPNALSAPPSYARPEASPPRPAHTPPKPPQARVSHPLPPKPPPSLDQMKSQREHKNKRKQDRQHNHQDKRHKDHKPNNRPPQSSPQYESHRPTSSAGRHSAKSSPRQRQSNQGGTGQNRPLDSTPVSHLPGKPMASGEVKDILNEIREPTTAKPDSAFVDMGAKGNQMANCREPESPQHSDAADPPQVEDDNEDPSSASLRDEQPSSVGPPDEAVEVKRPDIEEEDQETCKEACLDEGFSRKDSSPTPAARGPVSTDEERRSPAVDNQMNRKRGRSIETKEDDERHTKKHRSDSPRQSTDKVSQESAVGSDLWDVLKVPRQMDRKRRDSTGSRGSRRSSVSSKSSDLNSLEAELLGRPAKQKQSEPSPTSRQQRQDHKAPLKAKRRQQNTNSAYSRRW